LGKIYFNNDNFEIEFQSISSVKYFYKQIITSIFSKITNLPKILKLSSYDKN